MTPNLLYADCTVTYDGRAYSTLPRGNYLIIIKDDNSVGVHASTRIAPRNYQSGGKTTRNGEQIVFTNKGETITVLLHEVYFETHLTDWSNKEVQISRTEQDLTNKLFHNWDDYFDDSVEMIYTEYATPLGPIDLLGINANLVYHVVEVKRGNCTVNAVTQLNKYVDALRKQGKRVRGYLSSPSIGTNAMNYLIELGYEWVRVDF